jgi:pyruvate ferredoxin oxidoreductase beta subunit
MNVISPCPLGWGYSSEKTIEIAKLAVDTCFWPLFEVENGLTWKLSYKPAAKKPITDYLKAQVRFRHLLRPENTAVVEAIQKRVDDDWAALLKRCNAEG